MPTVDALLFDLGNVLIEVDPHRCFSYWQQFSPHSAEQLSKMPVLDTAFEQHEVGELSDEQYFDYLRELMSLDATTAEIKTGWDAMLGEQITATIALVERASKQLPCYIFSNTNPSHQQRWSDLHADFLSLFQQVYVSSDIKRRKPEVEAYLFVCQEIGVPAERVLFFDDREDNIAGARAAGLRAVQVHHSSDVEQALKQQGLM
ncbi:MAG: HAD family hydrolase [Granulosicoccaceae bacterium]